MKKLMIATCALMFCFTSSPASAQNCKPDVSKEDKISKERVEIWAQVLFSTSFGSSLMSTSEMSVTATIGRYGAINAVNLELQKREESATNSAFESAFRGVVGKTFYFGFKNGDPAAFVVTEVGNNAKVQQGLFAAKGVTTVVLSAVVNDKELATLRDALTTRQIDAIRMVLAGDVRIEQSVNDKNGRKMMEKFSCFYQSLDKRGIVLAPASSQNPSAQPASAGDNSMPPRDYAALATGKYVSKSNSRDFLDLSPNGMYSLSHDGKSIGGSYTVQGDKLNLTFQQNNKSLTISLRFVNDTIVDPDGVVWEKQADPQKSAPAQLTIDQIIQMAGAKLPDDVIIATIRKSASKFDLTPDALIKLKNAGVSDAVLRAMMQ
jgi:hypothetical protein